jgi:hypothetical protein
MCVRVCLNACALPRQEVEPSAAAYHAAMFACGKPDPGRWAECVDLLREMKGKGLPVGVSWAGRL